MPVLRRARPTVELTNPQWGGWGAAFLRGVMVVLLWAVIPGGLAATAFLASYMERVPPTPDISKPSTGHATEIFSTDGTRVGGLLKGRRPRAQFGEIPARVKFAFLAAEDDAFFEHEGFDLIAIARAFLRNRAAGRVVEGGSTITQQLAKASLTNAKSYDRKILEVFLARRIEATWSKAEILEAYLNEVYLGAGAHGVVAAAEIYFGKTLDELTWGEATLIAGVTTSPSSLNPFRRPERALERRRLILKRLVATGVMTEDEAARVQAEPLKLRGDWDGDEDTIPYAAVDVRETIKRLHGDEVLASGGLDVTLSVSPALQAKARSAVADGLRKLDRRQGWRGPLARLGPERFDAFAKATADVYALPPADAPWTPEDDRPYLGLVTRADPESIDVRVGHRTIPIGLEGARWVFPYDIESRRNAQGLLEDMTTAFAPGDVIVVAHGVWSRSGGRKQPPILTDGWRVDQLPKVEGLLLSVDVETGYARAAVGGWDFDRSEYNRALHACRQPGSVFKPIVYSRALEQGLTPATVLSDAPYKVRKAGGEVWKPKNADRKFSGFLILRDALARSRNLPSFEVFRWVGAEATARQAYRLGITTRMAETESLSLGASCVKPWDLARVYGTFARRGVRMEPRLTLTLREHRGRIMTDFGHFADLSVPTSARWDRLVRDVTYPPDVIMREDHAYQLQYLLRSVVIAGTAYQASKLGVPVAGKTGTTNMFDTWFVGFSQSVMTSVWVGADNNDRPVGSRETGGRTALPVWLDYMRFALRDRAQGRILADPPEGIDITRIDRDLGLKSKAGEPGLDLPFLEGTAPTREAPDRKEKEALRVDREASSF